MLNIGLTGNRYSGKKRISKLFKQIHIPVFDADTVLRFAIFYNTELNENLKSELEDYYFDFGLLNMKKVIKDGKFNEVVRFYEEDLFKAYNRFNLKNKNSVYTIFKSSLLFELGWDKKMDSNINIFAPSNVRIDRCRFHTEHSMSEIYQLVKTEMDDLDKNKKADYVIHNYEPNDVLTEVSKIDNVIIDRYLYTNMTEQL
jgi:dephospho-CoA kinase